VVPDNEHGRQGTIRAGGAAGSYINIDININIISKNFKVYNPM